MFSNGKWQLTSMCQYSGAKWIMVAFALNEPVSVCGDEVYLKSIKEVITKKETLAATHGDIV